jgi:hypothetical protein
MEDQNSGEQPAVPELPCIARVVSHGDSKYMGKLRVELLRNVGNNNETQPGQIIDVHYMSPFFGTTSENYLGEDPDDYNNTQKSYGMWMIPPDAGTYGMVVFHQGKIERGYWIGGIPYGPGVNFMMPGVAATKYNNDDSSKRLPVADLNRLAATSSGEDTKILKPRHPFADVLDNQGLLEDDARGITSSSARRETPSMVFGISTPGPFDKEGKEGLTGEAPKKKHTPVSHLGGTTFVMDDGDDKYIRDTAVTDGPPKYIAKEQGEEGGEVTIPHNELVRIRTRTGHQILLHNSEDLIYITNSRGTAWIEMTSDGKIDIYAQDSISVRTQNDFNFYADRDFNIEVGRNFNLKVASRHQTEVGADKITIVNGNVVLKTDGNHDETVSGTTTISTGSGHTITAGGAFEVSSSGTNIDGGEIHLNSGNFGGAAAATPEPLSTFSNPTQDESTLESIMLRVPTTEPYPHHENLDATKFKTDLTDRESGSAIQVPEYWKKYSTDTDTFEQIQPPEENPEEDQQ